MRFLPSNGGLHPTPQLLSYALHLLFSSILSANAAESKFKTEPSIFAEVFNITHITSNRTRLQHGYIFLTPTILGGTFGPQIYTIDGELVYAGDSRRPPQGFGVCDFHGETGTHLCVSVGQEPHSRDYGAKRVLDSTYKQPIEDLETSGSLPGLLNDHDFKVVQRGTSYLSPVYVRRRMDLRPYLGPEKGYVTDACFVELSFTGETLFQWCALDHMGVEETFRWLDIPGQINLTGSFFGDGRKKAWDFGHMNSVDKNVEGDYMVSMRHLNQVVKVAGPTRNDIRPGTIIWRLGGRSGDVEMQGFSFSMQHHARFLSTDTRETTISLFNNGWEGINKPSAEASSCMIIVVNNATMTATLQHQYFSPTKDLSPRQGSCQVLPNKNVFVGWGKLRNVTEFDFNGEMLYHATFKNNFPYEEWSYRSLKYPWTAKPYWPPKLIVYQRSCQVTETEPLLGYVSWNGATEIDRWRFSGADSRDGPWEHIRTVPKEGFETRVRLMPTSLSQKRDFREWVRAEALDQAGNVLGSTVSRTYVPVPSLSHRCDADGCEPGFDYEGHASNVQACKTGYRLGALTLCILFITVESVAFVTQRANEPRPQWIRLNQS